MKDGESRFVLIKDPVLMKHTCQSLIGSRVDGYHAVVSDSRSMSGSAVNNVQPAAREQ